MAAYADYEFYTQTYKGAAIATSDFPRLILRASAVIDRITFGRAAAVMETEGGDGESAYLVPVKNATCAVAEEMNKIDTDDGKVIQSERVGQHSVTYAVPTTSDEARYSKAARLYLAMTGLMYRGVDAD